MTPRNKCNEGRVTSETAFKNVVSERSIAFSMMKRFGTPTLGAVNHFGLIVLRMGMVVAVLMAAALGTLPSSAQGTVAAPESVASIADVAHVAVEAPSVSGPQFSSDSTHILYVVSQASVAENHVVAELFVQSLGRADAPSGPPVRIARAVNPRKAYQFFARWCPDGKCVTYVAPPSGGLTDAIPGTLLCYDIHDGRSTAIPIQDTEPSASAAPDTRPPIKSVGQNYEWAPSGRLIAFTAPLETTKPITHTRGVRVDAATTRNDLTFPTRIPAQGLFLLEPHTGRIAQLSPRTLSVAAFGWAPNADAIAVAASEMSADGQTLGSDIFVINRTARTVRRLVSRPGQDTDPVWSPDGQLIAFRSSPSGGVGYSLNVVSVGDGRIVHLEDEDSQDSRTIRDVAWAREGRVFYYSTFSRMTTRLYRADVTTGRIVPMPVDEDAGANQLRVSPDGQWLTFVRSTFNVPPELWVRGLPDGFAKQVTHLSPNFPLASKVIVERVRWPSRDGRDTIHGLLVTPRMSDLGGGGTERTGNSSPLPTVVFVNGGPSMVHAEYQQFHTEILSLAVRGYAVLVPNTRGRAGYGSAYSYRRGYADPIEYARVPYEDVMTGVDYLIQRGIADGTRLGIIGHSYGGYVAAYAVTQTHRFKAAIDYEGGGSQLMLANMEYQPRHLANVFNVNMGVRNPFLPGDRDKLFAVSPAFNLHCVATPMLLLFGEQTRAKERNALLLFSGFQRFNVPVELVLYDEGHVFELPTAQVDYVTRMGAWFDYWVRGLAYNDPELSVRYDAWRAASTSARSANPPCASATASQ